MANLIRVHCKQRSGDIWEHLQNYSLFIQPPNRSKSFCILSFIWQLEGCGRCVCVCARRGRGTQYWYSIKTEARCFVCQVLAGLFALKAIQRGLEQMAGRSCLCYFWTFPLKVSDRCLPPPSPTHACFSFFLFLSSFKPFFFTMSPQGRACFCLTTLWPLYYHLSKLGEVCKGLNACPSSKMPVMD